MGTGSWFSWRVGAVALLATAAILLVASFFVPGGAAASGWTLYPPLTIQQGISIDIETGSSANTVEKPSGSYKREDLKVRDNSGNVINFNDKYRVTGTMHFAKGSGSSGDVCYVTVTKIEK